MLGHEDVAVALVGCDHVLILVIGAFIRVVGLQEYTLVSEKQELILAAVRVSEMLNDRCDRMFLNLVLELFLDKEKLFMELGREPQRILTEGFRLLANVVWILLPRSHVHLFNLVEAEALG